MYTFELKSRYALSLLRAQNLAEFGAGFFLSVFILLPDNVVSFVQDASASWRSWSWFIPLMMLRLWMQWQFIIFVIKFFAAAFPIAMNYGAAGRVITTVSTFRRMTFLFLMNYRWHIFDMRLVFLINKQYTDANHFILAKQQFLCVHLFVDEWCVTLVFYTWFCCLW